MEEGSFKSWLYKVSGSVLVNVVAGLIATPESPARARVGLAEREPARLRGAAGNYHCRFDRPLARAGRGTPFL